MKPKTELEAALDAAMDELYTGMQEVDMLGLVRGRPEEQAICEATTQLLALLAATRIALKRAAADQDLGGPKDKPGLTLYKHIGQAVEIICQAVERQQLESSDDVLTMIAATHLLRVIEGLNIWLAEQLAGEPNNGGPQWFQDMPLWGGREH